MRTWFRLSPIALVAAVFLALALMGVGRSIHPEEMDLLDDHRLLHATAERVSDEACERLTCIRAGGRAWPLTEDSPYVGAVELYLQQPFFLLLGESFLALRLPPVLLGLATLLSAAALCRRWFGPRVAFLAAILTATHPAFVHFARQGHAAEEGFSIGFFWTALYAFTRALEAHPARAGPGAGRSTGAAWAFLGALCLGLGVSHKVTFLWFLVGFAAALPFLPATGLRWRRPTGREVVALATGLISGGFLLLAYNVRSGGGTPRRLWAALVQPLQKGEVANWHYLENLATRCRQIWETTLLSEFWFWRPLYYRCRPDGGPPCDVSFEPTLPLWGLGVVFLAGLVAVPAVRARAREGWGAVPWLWTFYGVVFLCTPFTVSGRVPNHLTVMHPFVGIVVALTIEAVAGRGAVWRARLAGLLGVILVASNAWLTLEIHAAAPPGTGLPEGPWSIGPSRPALTTGCARVPG